MTDIASWLKRNSLERHLELFLEAEIDVDLLPELTEEDIEALGLPIGARRRLKIALANDVSSDVAEGTTEGTTQSAERRQLSIMFCDLVGSVELGERMDVEDYRELLAAVREATVAGVACFDGFVARYQGDGVLVYFGYPHATENDAERSVRAALAVVQRVEGLKQSFGVTPQVRIGIATGSAVVGDVLSTGASAQSEFAALGATPNLAARLQGVAQPNGVVVSQVTEQLCRGLFTTDALPDLVLKGFQDRVTAFEIRSETIEATPSSLLDRRALSPLVGRQGELALIQGRWEQACNGSGQAVLLSAEPGVGKSRLVYELRNKFTENRHQRFTFYCSPYHVGTALHPVVESVGRTLGFEMREGPESRASKVREWIMSLGLDANELVPVIAPLLFLPEDPSFKAPPSEELGAATLSALLKVIEASSEQSPLFLVAEDLHWADPTTLELLCGVVEQIRDKRVLALMTFRPEFAHSWHAHANVTSLTLNHLTENECEQLVRSVAGSDALQDPVMVQILARADGVALFVEELSRNMVEAAGHGGDNQVPATLRDALMARLDRLGSAKVVAQLASVIGRQFKREWLLVASSAAEGNVDEALEKLVGSGLVHRRGGAENEFQFKHALVRDTAYDSLLRDEKERLHGEVADALAPASGGDGVPEEVIGRHYALAGRTGQALAHWRRAWEVTHRRGADREASALARSILSGLRELDAAAEELVPAARNLADSLHRSGCREESLGVLLEHKPLLSEIGDKLVCLEYLRLMGMVAGFLGNRQDARLYYEEAEAIAREQGDDSLVMRAAAALIVEDIFGGDLRTALSRCEAFEHLFENVVEQITEDADVPLMMPISWAHWWSGRAKRGEELGRVFWETSKAHDLTFSKSHAAFVLGGSLAELGELDEAIAIFREALADAAPFGAAIVYPALGSAVFEKGDAEQAILLMEEGVERAREYRSKQIQAWAGLNLAEAYCRRGLLEQAKRVATEWRDTAEEAQAKHLLGRSHWVLGLVAAKNGQTGVSEGLFESALSALDAAGALADFARASADAASLYAQTEQLSLATTRIERALDVWARLENPYQARRVRQIAALLGVRI